MCWVNKSNTLEWAGKNGTWYSPEQVAAILRPYPKARFSSGEPLLSPNHLLEVAKLLPQTLLLIESNGLTLNEDTAKALSLLKNVYFRLSFKGVDSRSSEITTGLPIFDAQLEAATLMSKYNIAHHYALVGVYSPSWVRKLEKEVPDSIPTQFYKSSSRITKLELEQLKIYPFHKRRIEHWLKELRDENYTGTSG